MYFSLNIEDSWEQVSTRLLCKSRPEQLWNVFIPPELQTVVNLFILVLQSVLCKSSFAHNAISYNYLIC